MFKDQIKQKKKDENVQKSFIDTGVFLLLALN
jgi:hypothetical protein